MIQMNDVKLIGRLTGDADIRDYNGTACAGFSLAVDDGFFDKQANEWKDRVVFVDCSAFGYPADTIQKEGIKKGTPVLLKGKLQLDRWEKDGSQFQKITVRAAKIQRIHQPPKRDAAPHPAETADNEDIPFM